MATENGPQEMEGYENSKLTGITCFYLSSRLLSESSGKTTLHYSDINDLLEVSSVFFEPTLLNFYCQNNFR